MAGVIIGVFMLSLASPTRDTYLSGVLIFGMVYSLLVATCVAVITCCIDPVL
jgi:hypothetical protein